MDILGAGIPRQDFPIPGVICSDTLEPLNANFISVRNFLWRLELEKETAAMAKTNIFQSLFGGILSVRVLCKVHVNRNISGKNPLYERAGGGMSENTLLPSSISLVSAGRPLSPASAWKNDGMKSLLEAWFFCCLWSVLFPFYPFLPEPPVYGERFSPWSRHLERSNCLVPWLSVASCQKSLNRIYWHQIYSVHSTYQQSNKDNRFSEWYTRLYQTWVCAKHFNFCI